MKKTFSYFSTFDGPGCGKFGWTMFHLPQFPQIDIIGYPYMVVGFRRRGRPLCLPVGCPGLAIFPCLARFLETKGRHRGLPLR
jgi:hypothetical protein